MQRHIFYVPGLVDARVVKAAKPIAVAHGATIVSESRSSFLVEIAAENLTALSQALPAWSHSPEQKYKLNPPRARIVASNDDGND